VGERGKGIVKKYNIYRYKCMKLIVRLHALSLSYSVCHL